MLQYGIPNGQAEFECQTTSNYLDTEVTIMLCKKAQIMGFFSVKWKIQCLKQT